MGPVSSDYHFIMQLLDKTQIETLETFSTSYSFYRTGNEHECAHTKLTIFAMIFFFIPRFYKHVD